MAAEKAILGILVEEFLDPDEINFSMCLILIKILVIRLQLLRTPGRLY